MRDKYNREIEKYDLIKIFHFIGARNKRYYMYKLAVIRNGQLVLDHLSNQGYCQVSACQQKDMEIVQSKNWRKLDRKVKNEKS